jgi:hypothetical protein
MAKGDTNKAHANSAFKREWHTERMAIALTWLDVYNINSKFQKMSSFDQQTAGIQTMKWMLVLEESVNRMSIQLLLYRNGLRAESVVLVKSSIYISTENTI